MEADDRLQDPTGTSSEEHVETLLRWPGGRLERIVSYGHRSPEGFWYDQDEHEWVQVVSGRARLEIEGMPVLELGPGDRVWLPAHTRHRVLWTEPDVETVWTALFLDQASGRVDVEELQS
jgi:cupin 2 domain-containing protein